MLKFIIILGILISLCLIIPAFLLPKPLYEALYGWRYPKTWRCADAVVTDYGPAVADNKITVKLGQINLNAAGNYSYNLCGLPYKKPLLAGVIIPLIKGDLIYGYDLDIVTRRKNILNFIKLEMRLFDTEGQMLMNYSGGMGLDWYWQTPYFVDNNHDEPSIYIYGALQFQAKKGKAYQLVVNVKGAEQNLDKTANVILTGHGWK